MEKSTSNIIGVLAGVFVSLSWIFVLDVVPIIESFDYFFKTYIISAFLPLGLFFLYSSLKGNDDFMNAYFLTLGSVSAPYGLFRLLVFCSPFSLGSLTNLPLTQRVQFMILGACVFILTISLIFLTTIEHYEEHFN